MTSYANVCKGKVLTILGGEVMNYKTKGGGGSMLKSLLVCMPRIFPRESLQI